MSLCFDNQYNECTAITAYKPKYTFRPINNHSEKQFPKITQKNLS